MKTLPGFTADASVYETTGSYRMAAAHAPAGAFIHPALVRDPDCVDRCILTCADRGSFAQACFNHCIKRCPVLVLEEFPRVF